MLTFLLQAQTPPGPAGDLIALFHLDQGWPALQEFRRSLGTATSGHLGAIVLSFFLISLFWGWVKNKFDAWPFWDLFLRLFLVAAGLFSWDALFKLVDDDMNWLATGGTLIEPYSLFANVCAPFNNLVVEGYVFGQIAGDLFNFGALLLQAIESFLVMLVTAAFSLSVIAQQILTMILYCFGPFFLTTWIFDPLSDLWMRWVRNYITVKLWLAVMYFSLFVLSLSIDTSSLHDIFSASTWMLPASYLIVLLLLICASYPLAKALVGGAVTPAFSGAMVPGIASATVSTVATVGGIAAGTAIAGPAGAAIGGSAGGAAGKAGGTAVNPPGRQ
jgi:hypothetical protein